jgi:hypothetical protein
MTQHKLSSYHVEKIRKLSADLMCAFDWHSSPEGSGFWCDIHKDLCNRAEHGTSDGKPWVEPELTDEDAKQRPWVMVRDSKEEEWGRFVLRLIYVKPKGSDYRFVTEDPKDDHGVFVWNYCRLATPEEIEAANANR